MIFHEKIESIKKECFTKCSKIRKREKRKSFSIKTKFASMVQGKISKLHIEKQ
jgi:hypothetical protein